MNCQLCPVSSIFLLCTPVGAASSQETQATQLTPSAQLIFCVNGIVHQLAVDQSNSLEAGIDSIVEIEQKQGKPAKIGRESADSAAETRQKVLKFNAMMEQAIAALGWVH